MTGFHVFCFLFQWSRRDDSRSAVIFASERCFWSKHFSFYDSSVVVRFLRSLTGDCQANFDNVWIILVENLIERAEYYIQDTTEIRHNSRKAVGGWPQF